jgi:pimeloyl-ACP methyl ester carboxylesterase
VRSLTLISCIANRSPAERAAVRARLALAGSDLAASQEAALARWGEEHRAVIAPVLRANDPASYLACYRVFVEADGEVWPLYPGLSMPVLAITGAEDGGSTPAMAAALAAAVPDGECEIVPGARHLLPLDAPVALAAAIMRTSRRAER